MYVVGGGSRLLIKAGSVPLSIVWSIQYIGKFL